MSSGALTSKESTRSEGMITTPSDRGSMELIRGHPPCIISLAVHQHLTRHSSQLLQILTLRRKQAASCHARSDHTTGSLHLLFLCLDCSYADSHAAHSPTSFRSWLKCYHFNGLPWPSSMEQNPSHFLSSLLCFVLFFSALITTWPIL